MTALNNQWQAARQLRRETVVQRRQQVYTALADWQQSRLVNTAKLRQSLNQMYANLQDETALWLTQARQHRIIQARQLRQKLAADQRELEAAVSDLRLEIAQDLSRIQRRVDSLCQETATMRAGHRQEQAMMRSQLLPELEAYIDDLKQEVADSLSAITAARLAAATPRRERRQQERQALTEEVDTLFNDLATFRQGLRTFRQGLTTQVWGSAVDFSASEVKPVETKPPAAPQPQSRRRRVVVKGPTPPPAAVKQAPASAPTPSPAPIGVIPSIAITPPAAAVTTAAAPAAKSDGIEESVYNYLHQSQGARLTEIETQLGINRFQAVDALRSLIQKELIVQEDRIYHVQEEAVL